MAHCTGLRGPGSAEPGTLLQEAVGDNDGDEHDDEEGNIYMTFAVRRALCCALHSDSGSEGRPRPRFADEEVRS